MKKYLRNLAQNIVDNEMTESNVEYDIDMLLDTYNVLLDKESEEYLKSQIKSIYRAKFINKEDIISFFVETSQEDFEFELEENGNNDEVYIQAYEYVNWYFKEVFSSEIATKLEENMS